jgi:hypothetical protein
VAFCRCTDAGGQLVDGTDSWPSFYRALSAADQYAFRARINRETRPMSIGDAVDIAFDVAGPPPIKNEALSLLSAGHKQHERVRALLEAAAAEAQRISWAVASAEP